MRTREALEIFASMVILPNTFTEYEATRIVQEYIQNMLEQESNTPNQRERCSCQSVYNNTLRNRFCSIHGDKS